MVSGDGKGSRLLRTGLFALGLAVLLGLCSWLYRPRDNSTEGGMPNASANGWRSEPVGSIDVFFVGSSEFYSAVAPLRIWDEAGITTYDVTTGSQRLYLAEQYVAQLLRERQPKLIVVDAYVIMTPVDWNEALFNAAARPLPILNWHENWKCFDWETLRAPAVYTTHYEKKGFRPRGQSVSVKRRLYMRPTEERYAPPLLNWLYFQRIRALCREAGVELLLLSIPSPRNWNMRRANTLRDYGERYGVGVLDLNLTEGLDIDPATDYRDDGDHMNGAGARKVSVYMASYLREHYHLTDHRGDPDFLPWQEDYANYYGS